MTDEKKEAIKAALMLTLGIVGIAFFGFLLASGGSNYTQVACPYWSKEANRTVTVYHFASPEDDKQFVCGFVTTEHEDDLVEQREAREVELEWCHTANPKDKAEFIRCRELEKLNTEHENATASDPLPTGKVIPIKVY